MSDKAIILSVILAAVLCVAVPFIFRVCRYRRRMKTLIVPDGPSGEVAVGTVPTPDGRVPGPLHLPAAAAFRR